MQKLPKPARIALLSLLVVDLAAVVYMMFVAGLLYAPLQDLPFLYWVLLFTIPTLLLLNVLFSDRAHSWPNTRGTLGDPKSSTMAQIIVSVLSGSLMLLIGLDYVIWSPKYGGNGAFLIAIGCASLVTAFSLYRRYQLVK